MKKILCFLLTALIAVFPLSACKDKDGLKKVRLNEVTHSVFYAPLYLAIELGYFEEEGIEIELTNGGGADKSMTAILSGSADIGLMGPEAAIYVYNEGRENHPVVFGQLTKRDGSFLFSRNPEPDFKWEDLEGKHIIAGRKGGVPAMTLEYVLNQHGLYNGENVTLNFDIAFNLQAGAFEGGTGDYTTLFEPTASDMQAAGKGYIVASVGEASGEIPYTAFMCSKKYLQKNAKTIQAFLRAVQRAEKYIQTESETTCAQKLVPQFAGTSVESLTQTMISYKTIDAWMHDMCMKEESFNRLMDVMQNAGELDTRAKYSDLVFNDYAQAVFNEIYG